jgi:hypothetical protein
MKPLDLDRKRDLGRILDDSFALYRAHWRTLLAVSALIVVPVVLVVYGIGFGWFTGGYDDTTTGDEVQLEDVLPVFGGLLAQLLIITPLVTATTVHVVEAAAKGERLTPGQAIRAGLDDFPVLLPAVVLMFGGLVLGFIALIIPGLILTVRWAVVSQAVVIEDKRGTAALGRSFELTRGRGWFTFLVVLVVALLTGVVTALLQLPLDEAGRSADTMLYPLLGEILGTVLVLPVVATAYTLLYHSLLAHERGTPTFAPPSGPAAAAPPPPPPAPPRSIEGVPGTFGDGWAPPAPPAAND